MKIIYLILIGFLSFITISHGQDTIFYQNNFQERYIGKNLGILQDEKGVLTFKDILSKKASFYLSETEVPNLGITNSYYWLKFTIKNTSDHELLMLELSYPLINEITLYSQSRGVITTKQSGDSHKFSFRKYNHQNYIFELVIPENESMNCYLRVKCTEQLLVPLSVSTPQQLAESLLVSDSISAMQFGVMLVMILYNLFIFVTVRDRSYIYYVSYIFFFGLMQATLQGYGFKYLWPDSSWLANQSVIITPSLAGAFAILFLKNFLQTEVNVPRLHKIFPLFFTVYFTANALYIIGYNTLSYKLIDINAILLPLFILYIAFQIARKKYRPAYFFLAAWATLLLGVTIFAFRNFGILPFNNFTNYIIQIGSTLEVILLSFALADRINIFKKDKEESQAHALEVLEENKRLITSQNLMLEEKVAERTKELEAAMKELKEAESHLIESEKMASLGQLTAGIAHEVNNPINFVVSNITPLKRDIEDIQELLSKYEAINESADLKVILPAIERFRKDIDIDFTKEEINLLLKGISEGATRTAEIVRSLKNFSRVDELDFKFVNINEGIKSTLDLLMYNFQNIELENNAGELPPIECYPGKLNQVFMNIITNAIQALQLHPVEGRKDKITINTTHANNNIIVRIKDNGIGMTDEVKKKIFEPFFTTKEVGKGTGLGLSITYSIIEKHSGTIQVNSQPNEGAEFVITLPLERQLKEMPAQMSPN